MQHGLFFDNEFNEETDALGYNRYRPVEDPLWHLEHWNSTDKPAIFNRLTGNYISRNSFKTIRVRVMVFNVTFNNISIISWRLVLLVEETGVPG
jgi:hypothetical protein